MESLKCALVGSRFFGATVFEALRREVGIEFTHVVAPAADDRLALAAQAAGIPVHVLDNQRLVPGHAIPEGTDLIIAAHTHARVGDDALARSRLGGVGYHPSLLPRHRGIAAVEWTVLSGDAIAGGSVYHLADGWDAGAVAVQDFCFVIPGETARDLWERALAPMGLTLLAHVVREARLTGRVPALAQDTRFATRAPMIRKAASADGAPAAPARVTLQLRSADRPDLLARLATVLCEHGIDISHLTLRSEDGPKPDEPRRLIEALLQVPATLALDSLRQALRALDAQWHIALSPGPPAAEAR